MAARGSQVHDPAQDHSLFLFLDFFAVWIAGIDAVQNVERGSETKCPILQSDREQDSPVLESTVNTFPIVIRNEVLEPGELLLEYQLRFAGFSVALLA